MRLLDILRCILLCGEDEESSYHSINRTSEPPPQYSHYYYDLESSPRPPPSNSTPKLSQSSLVSSRSYASNCAPNSSLPSSNPSPSLINSSKPLTSNASQNHKPSLPLSNPSPSPLPSSKPSSSASISSSKPSLSSISSSKLPSSISPSTHFSIPSSNAPANKNPCLPSSKLSLTSSNPFASNASRTHSSIPLPKPSLPTQSEKNQHKDLEELIKEAIVSSDPKSPKSPSTASPRETLRCTTKLADQRYEIPKHLEKQIKKDIAPEVLRKPLSPSTYSDYFAALLYAEDFYIEKWSKFLLSGVTLELQRREPFETFSREKKKQNEKSLKDKKPFVAFEIDNIPERRPYLLSRDFVFARRSSKTAEPFKGFLFRVVKSTTVLVEFGDDFHSQHLPSNEYDVSFSFNRVCLKRSHQAISAAKDSSLHDVLFPNLNSASGAIHLYRNYNHSQLSISNRILNHKGPLPYLIEGPLSTASNGLSRTGTVLQEAVLKMYTTSDRLSRTGTVLREAVLKMYTTSPECRILICSPTNLTCDVLMQSLYKHIPKEKLFRANAAFRDYDLVPDDIIPQSLYEGERFACPSLSALQAFNVITSTFVSSFRLHTAGLNAGHFTHILLVDASSAMEPEAVVPLANFVRPNTVVVVTGSSTNCPRWVRSDIGRKYGLKRSYFQRLLEREPYSSRDLAFISHLD